MNRASFAPGKKVVDKNFFPGASRPVFSYERISDEVQIEGVSLDFQNSHAEKYARDNSLYIHTNFSVIESASKEGRKVFNEMLDQAERLGIRDLIFKNTDRMSRNYQDLVRIEKLIEKGFNIHFYQSNLVINKDSNYNDRFLIGIQLAVAKHTSDKISQDIREHNKFKASQGIAPGPSPFGYKYDTKQKSHVIDSETEILCRKVFDDFDRGGYSLRDYADHLNAEGIPTPKGKQWRSSGLHYTLTNPFYHGEFWYQDRLWPGKHAPYYSKSRYEERVKRLGDGFRGMKKRTFQFRLAGLVRCSCGRLMSGEIKKGRYIYYGHRCERTGSVSYIPENKIFALMDDTVRKSCFSPMFSENLKRTFKKTFEQRTKDNHSELDRISAKLKAIDEKRARLIDLYTDSTIDREFLNRKMSELNSETDQLERYRGALGKDTGKTLELICKTIDSLRDEPDALLSASLDQKPENLRNLADGITINSDTLSLRWKKPYSFLMKPVLLEARNSAPPEKKTGRSESSESSKHAPPPGEFQNVLSSIIEEFVLYLAAV